MLPPTSLEVQEVIADTMQLQRLTMSVRERVTEILLSLSWIAATVVVWNFAPPGDFSVAPALVCFLVLILASRIRIDTPFGATAPTQLAFVPLLFALPLALVPIAVVMAMTVGSLLDVVGGRLRVSRLVKAIPNAWWAIGPVAVFEVAGTSPSQAGASLLVAALGAQLLVDFTTASIRNAMGRNATFADALRDSWIWVVDAALSGVALLVAEEVHKHPISALAPLPLLGIVAIFAKERRQRLEGLTELNAAYKHARDEAVEASNMKSAFLRNVSHEIRTPMNGVMGMTELLLSTPLNDEQRTYAEQVEQSGEHMLTIINDILDISQIETGRVELEISDFDVAEAVERSCVTGALEAQDRGLSLEVEIDPRASGHFRGDEARFRQVVMNLVANAVKFTAEGSIRVRVRERPDPGIQGIRVEVVDTGIGIEPSLLEKMFEPFVQADGSTTRKYGGNGLGLSIAKELVELMGGLIGGDSEPGQGSTFWFELPVPRVATATHANRERGISRDVRPTDPNAPHVLVVEDSPVNRLVTVRVLERSGFRAHVVNDGSEALDALSTQIYDAVLMDCQMPEVDGYEATRELRRREAALNRYTPVIAMTAHAMTGDRQRCLDAGMDDYITKPVRSQMLVETLRRWIEHSRRSAEADGKLVRAGSDQVEQ